MASSLWLIMSEYSDADRESFIDITPPSSLKGREREGIISYRKREEEDGCKVSTNEE
jgi:hypothetical protein